MKNPLEIKSISDVVSKLDAIFMVTSKGKVYDILEKGFKCFMLEVGESEFTFESISYYVELLRIKMENGGITDYYSTNEIIAGEVNCERLIPIRTNKEKELFSRNKRITEFKNLVAEWSEWFHRYNKAGEADAESQSFVPVVEDVPAVAKSNNVSSIAGETKIKEEALNDLTAFFKDDSIRRDEFLETCINVSSFRVLESYLNCVGYKFANELVHGNIRGSVYTLKRLHEILLTLGVVNNTLKSFRADYKKLKNNEE